MERAFKISDTSKYAVDLDKYIERVNYTNSKIKELTEKLGIEANMYFLHGNGMCNIPFNEFSKKDMGRWRNIKNRKYADSAYRWKANPYVWVIEFLKIDKSDIGMVK